MCAHVCRVADITNYTGMLLCILCSNWHTITLKSYKLGLFCMVLIDSCNLYQSSCAFGVGLLGVTNNIMCVVWLHGIPFLYIDIFIIFSAFFPSFYVFPHH